MRVLLASDTQARSGALAEVLRRRGYPLVLRYLDGTTPLAAQAGDVVVFDLSLPDGERALAALRALRQTSPVPVLVLAGPADPGSAVRWLKHGADDYLAKPAQTTELIARIEALARRGRTPVAHTSHVIKTMNTIIDLNARAVWVNGNMIGLTKTEFAILAALARCAGVAVSREDIMVKVWGDGRRPSSRALDVHLGALRAKLGNPRLLETLYGFGYRLVHELE